MPSRLSLKLIGVAGSCSHRPVSPPQPHLSLATFSVAIVADRVGPHRSRPRDRPEGRPLDRLPGSEHAFGNPSLPGLVARHRPFSPDRERFAAERGHGLVRRGGDRLKAAPEGHRPRSQATSRRRGGEVYGQSTPAEPSIRGIRECRAHGGSRVLRSLGPPAEGRDFDEGAALEPKAHAARQAGEYPPAVRPSTGPGDAARGEPRKRLGQREAARARGGGWCQAPAGFQAPAGAPFRPEEERGGGVRAFHVSARTVDPDTFAGDRQDLPFHGWGLSLT